MLTKAEKMFYMARRLDEAMRTKAREQGIPFDATTGAMQIVNKRIGEGGKQAPYAIRLGGNLRRDVRDICLARNAVANNPPAEQKAALRRFDDYVRAYKRVVRELKIKETLIERFALKWYTARNLTVCVLVGFVAAHLALRHFGF